MAPRRGASPTDRDLLDPRQVLEQGRGGREPCAATGMALARETPEDGEDRDVRTARPIGAEERTAATPEGPVAGRIASRSASSRSSSGPGRSRIAAESGTRTPSLSTTVSITEGSPARKSIPVSGLQRGSSPRPVGSTSVCATPSRRSARAEAPAAPSRRKARQRTRRTRRPRRRRSAEPSRQAGPAGDRFHAIHHGRRPKGNAPMRGPRADDSATCQPRDFAAPRSSAKQEAMRHRSGCRASDSTPVPRHRRPAEGARGSATPRERHRSCSRVGRHASTRAAEATTSRTGLPAARHRDATRGAAATQR